jgi:hypothetical protein
VLDHQGAAGILPKPSDERKRGEAFPTTKISEQIPSLLAAYFFHMQPLQFTDVRLSTHAQAGPIHAPEIIGSDPRYACAWRTLDMVWGQTHPWVSITKPAT